MPEKYKSKSIELWGPANYIIEVEGSLSKSWGDCLAGMHSRRHTRENGSTFTTLSGRVIDQGELLGILNSLYELHLPLLSLKLLDQ